jgi:hypothetical protein
MKGDFSRSTHRPTNHYSAVRLQQGRVLVDAEWNEQADIAGHLTRSTTSDVVGASGTPKSPAGAFEHFMVAVDDGGKDLRIAPGRIYVDGILCENDEAAGVLYSGQADLPGAPAPPADGNYAVYLDVWERHLTAVDQYGATFPSLLEPALQGPDTATRTRVVWQVKLAPVQSKTCAAFSAPAPPTGRLRAQEIQSTTPGDDCSVPSGGGYRRLENQLYRVEVHAVEQGTPVLKWSRDNGSVASKVKAVDATALTIAVEDEGRDELLGFGGARWVELTDEERILRGEPGALFEVDTVTGASVVVKNPSGLSFATGTNLTLRRWDGRLTLAANTPTELEDGVQVEIDGGSFTSGDYWTIPARTLTGKVEWPRDQATPPAPVFELRHGTAHHYCLLSVVEVGGGTFSAPLDCRPLFPPLTGITATDVGYDPATCANLAGATTVQAAIDILCQSGGGEDQPAIHVQQVTLLSGNKPLVNDSLVTPEELAGGIWISCDRELFQDSVRNANGPPNPVCLVTLDLPWPTNDVDRGIWLPANQFGANGFIGFVTLTLAADVTADNKEIIWNPSNQAPSHVQAWLEQRVLDVVRNRTDGGVRRLLCRLTLKGNYIWGPTDPELYLDGDAFGIPGGDHVDVLLPSGNGRRGGDFEMWFWLGRQ